jgi:hypothetical protein
MVIESAALATSVGPGTSAGPAALVLKPQIGSPPGGPPATWTLPARAHRSHEGEHGNEASDADGTVAGARARLASRVGGAGGLMPGLGAAAGLGLGVGEGWTVEVVGDFVGAGVLVGVGVGLGEAAWTGDATPSDSTTATVASADR